MTGCRNCLFISVSAYLTCICILTIFRTGCFCCICYFVIMTSCRDRFFFYVSCNGIGINNLTILCAGCFHSLCFFPCCINFFLCRFCLCFGLSLCFVFRFWRFFCFGSGCLVICWWLCFCFGLCCT